MPSSVKDRFTVDFEKVFFFVKSRKYWFEMQYEPYSVGTIQRVETSPGTGSGMSFGTKNQRYARLNKLPDKLDKVRGRNKRCVWTITTKPFKEAHFATFPEKLIEPMIKAGCPEFVCRECGKAREKVRELVGGNTTGHTNRNKEKMIQEGKFYSGNVSCPLKQNEVGIYKEIGFTDCGCNAGFDGGIVLDPFMGSGTTALVAKKLNRHYVGIELNPEYVKMAEKRIKDFGEVLI